jgi:hypothetical protein
LVGTVSEKPPTSPMASVGDEGEDEVAGRDDVVALQMPRDGDHHAAHVLHVDRAAAPHVAVLHRTGERVDAPVGGLGGDDVEVAVDQQGAAAGVGAGQAGEYVAAAGRRLDILGFIADLFKLGSHPAGAFGLAFCGLRLAGVGRIEPDERADEVDDLILGGSHSHIRTTLGFGLGTSIR